MWILSVLLNRFISWTFDQLGCVYDFHRPSQRSVLGFLCTLSHDTFFQSVHLWLESVCIQVHTSLKIITLIHTMIQKAACVCFPALIKASLKHTRTSHPFARFGALKLERNSCSSAVGICWAKILSGIPGKTNYSQRGNKEGIKKRKGVIRSSRTKGQGRIGYQRGKEAVR